MAFLCIMLSSTYNWHSLLLLSQIIFLFRLRVLYNLFFYVQSSLCFFFRSYSNSVHGRAPMASVGYYPSYSHYYYAPTHYYYVSYITILVHIYV